MENSKSVLFKRIFNNSTSKAAALAHKEILRLHQEFPDAQTRDYKMLGRLIDGTAVKAMREVFETQPHFSIEIKGSEGRKDSRRDGIESPDLYGSYGPTGADVVEIVNDAVEGTAFASRNTPGATSILAACLNQKNGFLPTGNFDYMSKLFGPPILRGKISLLLSPSENIKIALLELKIKNPKNLSVVILDRPRNKFEIESAQNLGVNLILISGGDLTPSLLSSLNPEIISTLKKSKIPSSSKGVLVMGSGGWEEGIIAAACAKTSGGFAQGKIYSEDKEVIEQAKLLEINDLIPADPSSIMVSLSPITDDPWFGVSGVKNSKAQTICITQMGLEILKSE